METGQSAYRYQRTPHQKSITIASQPAVTLEEAVRFIEQREESALSADLIAAKRDLKHQLQDPELRETDIGGRDPRIDRFVLSRDELTQMSRLSPELWLRFIEYRYKFKIYPRRQILNDFPIVICVEPTSICNLRCQMCFQSDASFSSDKSFLGMMDFGLYTRIVDEMNANQCDSLVLASRGEPTLHPKFADMLSYATQRILDVKINTNATKLSEKLCHKILEADPNVVVFSIDSADPAQYEQIRKGAKFSEVLENVKRFRDIREKHYSQARTTTRISSTLFREDQDQQRIRLFWAEYADQVALHTAWPFWDSYHAPLSEVTNPCGLLWERVYIWWDGVCNPCDIDYKSLLSLGKIPAHAGEKIETHGGIKEIWLGERALQLRQEHQAARKNALVPCNRCSGTV